MSWLTAGRCSIGRAAGNPRGSGPCCAPDVYSRCVAHRLAVVVLVCAGGAAGAEPSQPPPEPSGRKLSPRSDAVLASYTATRDADLATWDLRLKAGAPLVRGDGFGVALLADYAATHLALDMPEGDEELTLHRFEATLGGGAGIAPGWSLRGSFGVNYGTDLQRATTDALRVTASAMAHHVLGPSDAVLAGAVYTQADEILPVLPLLGYVHQRDGSPLRIDVFLPHHARAEYALWPRVRGAFGLETFGSTWLLQMAQSQMRARRAGGSLFGELELLATSLVRVQARLGLTVARYTLPAPDGTPRDFPLRAAGFAQLAIVVEP